MADTLVIDRAQPGKVVIEKVAALGGKHDVGIAMNRVIDIDSVADDLEILIGNMTLDARQLTLERT